MADLPLAIALSRAARCPMLQTSLSGRSILASIDGDNPALRGLAPVFGATTNQADQLLDLLPAAVYVCAPDGTILRFNRRAAELWGRAPLLGDPRDRFCGSHRMYRPNGGPLPHDKCPMADILRDGIPVIDQEVIIERTDGSRCIALVNIRPLKDAAGNITGAVNCFYDITLRKHIDQEYVLTRGQVEELTVKLAQEREQQVALHRYTDRLYRADSRQAVHDAALDAITGALRCERAAILLFDEPGVMRFVAWRGLSDGYRRAVDGHSPWTRDAKDPQPICIEDIGRAELPDPLKATVKAEGIGALAFIPLMVKGELVGKFMTYYKAPHVFSDAEIDLAVTIARHLGFGIERMHAEEALREAQGRLVSELAATQQLQKISTQLIQENDVGALYQQILNAAVGIMRSDFASMQMLYPERGELRLLAYKGFDPAAAAFWEWVSPGSGSTCGNAILTGERSIVVDVDLSELMAGSEDLEISRKTGIRAVQSTPLVSRTGRKLGVISTHWRKPHQPDEHDLRLLDVLARQAADLIDRKGAEQTAQRLVAIVESSQDAIVSKDLDGTISSWNDGAARLFGYTAEEVIGKSILILIPPDRANEEPDILNHIRRGERIEHYETVRRRKDGTLIDISLSVSPVKDGSGKVIGASKIARDITDRKLAQERQELLIHEIHHRTKNIFSVVQAVIARSFADKSTVKEAEQAVFSRLHSLAQTHVMLIDNDWQGADIAEVVRTEMSPYADRTTIEGPTIVLNAKAAQNFALAVHELATNAAKYGALSNQSGRVHISWSVGTPNGHHQFIFRWQEHSGPPVSPPSRKGFGTTVLEQVMAEYFETPPLIEFAADGVRYAVIGSLEAITTQADPSA
jgi:PAS domain S-box-containing protein